MAYAVESWRSLYAKLRNESNPQKQLDLCPRARQLMQHRLVELSSQDNPNQAQADREREEIEEALRQVWQIEQSLLKSKS